MYYGIEVFFDENGPVLNDPEKDSDTIVFTEAINKDLNRSTHIICVVSEKTKESWCVPYEIGYVWNNKEFTHNIMAILLMKNITKLSEYLFLVKKVDTTSALYSFLKRIPEIRCLLTKKRLITKSFSNFISHPFQVILEW